MSNFRGLPLTEILSEGLSLSPKSVLQTSFFSSSYFLPNPQWLRQLQDFPPTPPFNVDSVASGDLPSSLEPALSQNLGGGLKVAESSQ